MGPSHCVEGAWWSVSTEERVWRAGRLQEQSRRGAACSRPGAAAHLPVCANVSMCRRVHAPPRCCPWPVHRPGCSTGRRLLGCFAPFLLLPQRKLSGPFCCPLLWASGPIPSGPSVPTWPLLTGVQVRPSSLAHHPRPRLCFVALPSPECCAVGITQQPFRWASLTS